MPYAAPRACLTPGCPGRAVEGGRCPAHRLTTSERGYGARWQQTSRSMRQGQRCQACGTTDDLTTDHLIPLVLGGTDAPANLRVLCRSCHGAIGAKRDRAGQAYRGGGVRTGFESDPRLTAAPLCMRRQVSPDSSRGRP